jgi:hemerythrin-like metal-binding protein
VSRHRNDEAFLAGLERIYAEHRRIFERIERLDAAIAARHPEEMRVALRFLMGDLVEHWVSEERFMTEVDYPALGDHHQLHELIQDRVMEARQAGIGSTSRLAEAAGALARAVEEHVRKDDLRLGEFVAARERLRVLVDGPDPGDALDIAAAGPALAPVRKDRAGDVEA